MFFFLASSSTQESSFIPPIPLLTRKHSPNFEALDLKETHSKKGPNNPINPRVRSGSISLRSRTFLTGSRDLVVEQHNAVEKLPETINQLPSFSQFPSPTHSPETKKRLEKLEKDYFKNLLKGTTEKNAKKGKLTNAEINWLIGYIKNPQVSPQHKLACCRSLCAAAFPGFFFFFIIFLKLKQKTKKLLVLDHKFFNLVYWILFKNLLLKDH